VGLKQKKFKRAALTQGFGALHGYILKDKHMITNFMKVQSQGLIEFRFGGMTTDWEKVVAYGTMAECIVMAAIKGAVSTKKTGVERFLDATFGPFMENQRVKESFQLIEAGVRA
jgi:hypothetical protein